MTKAFDAPKKTVFLLYYIDSIVKKIIKIKKAEFLITLFLSMLDQVFLKYSLLELLR